jgi:hypothetical protein
MRRMRLVLAVASGALEPTAEGPRRTGYSSPALFFASEGWAGCEASIPRWRNKAGTREAKREHQTTERSGSGTDRPGHYLPGFAHDLAGFVLNTKTADELPGRP